MKHAKLGWLNTHVSMMMSDRERHLKEKPSLPRSDGERARLEFKESLHIIFNFFAGLQGAQQHHIFALNNLDDGGIHAFFFVSALRLDLSSRAVVLDMAVLPLYNELIPKIGKFFEAVTKKGVRSIVVDGDELSLWKNVLPAFVERCRSWTRKEKCEYAAVGGRAPLSLEPGGRILCTCGNVVFSDDFKVNVPMWNNVSKYCVRAAASPAFYCSLVDEVYNVGMESEDHAEVQGGCRVCHKTKAEDGGELRKCANCRKAQYCSTKCQRGNREAHKGQCVSYDN